MLSASQIKVGYSYSYEFENEERIGCILNMDRGIIYLDNGDEIAFTKFIKIASLNSEFINSNTTNFDETNIPSLDIKVDKNGNPVLDTTAREEITNENKDLVAKTFGKNVIRNQIEAVNTSPIIELVKKAKKEKKTLQISLDIDVVSSSLILALQESFDENDINEALGYLISDFESKHLKQVLVDGLKRHYNINQ